MLFMGTAVLGFLLVLSWCFHVERTTGFDSAWQTWFLIFEGVPRCEHGRYSTMLAQVVPALQLWYGVSLENLLRGYSVSLCAVHLLVFAIVWAGLRDRKAAVALPLALVAMVGGSFYFGVSEIQQGLSSPILVWAFARRTLDTTDARKATAWGAGTALAAVWASFYHLVFVLPMIHLLVLELIARKAWRNIRYWMLVATVMCALVARKGFVEMSGYEKERMVSATEFMDLAGGWTELASTQYLFDALLRFPGLILLVACALVAAILRRRLLALLWTLVWTACCLLLILIADREMYSPYMYENLYPLIGVAWAILAADLYEGKAARPVVTVAMALVLLAGAWQIALGRFVPMDKVEYAERITTSLRARGNDKAIISAHLLPWTYVQTHWTLPFETLLISALQGPDSAVTVFAEEPMDKPGQCMHEPGRFIGPAWNPCAVMIAQLDTNYFRLSRQPYVIASSLPDSINANADVDSGTVTLAALVRRAVMRPGRYHLVPVRVCNNGTRSLLAQAPDMLNGVQGEIILKKNGEVIGRPWMALETDVPPGVCQEMALLVERPARAGEHSLILELLVNGKPAGAKDTLGLAVHSLGM